MTLEIKGKIVELLPLKSGQSANGEWRKQEYVLETDANYPKKICFMAWGDKIDQFNINKGDQVEVSIDLESREYNGRWYTDLKSGKYPKMVRVLTVRDALTIKMVILQRNLAAGLLRMMKSPFDGPILASAGRRRRCFQ